MQGARPSSYVYRDPLRFPRIELDDILNGSAEGVWIEPPGLPRSFLREPPSFHDDPDGVGLFPPFRRERILTAPNFMLSLRDATLMGFRSLMTPDGFFTNDLGHIGADASERFAASLPTAEEMAGLVFDGRGFAPDGLRPEAHLSGTVVILASVEPGNWGSFLYRDLVKLVDLPRLPDDWRFLAYAPQASFWEMLALAGAPMDRVINRDMGVYYRIDRAIVIGLRTPYAFADPATRRFYDSIADRSGAKADRRRIFISRGAVNLERRREGRVLVNEEEAVERLRALDFEVFEPEYLSAVDQMAAFRGAELVVGPAGSGLFDAVFCRPGAKLIDIESEPHWIFPHTCLFSSAGLEYGIVEGAAVDRDFTRHHKPWNLNVDALVRRIEAVMPRAFVSLSPPALPPSPNPAEAGSLRALRALHAALEPQTYLEIGVGSGASLALAQCATIGVDATFAFDRPFMGAKPSCQLFQTTSDAFFRAHSPTALFGAPVDLAVLDGARAFETVLCDVLEVERHCRARSVIVVRDALADDAAGDGWRAAALLKKHRPDMRIVALGAPPGGLVAITGLNPKSRTLEANYRVWVDRARNWSLAIEGEAFLTCLDMHNTAEGAEDLIALLRPG